MYRVTEEFFVVSDKSKSNWDSLWGHMGNTTVSPRIENVKIVVVKKPSSWESVV